MARRSSLAGRSLLDMYVDDAIDDNATHKEEANSAREGKTPSVGAPEASDVTLRVPTPNRSSFAP